MIYIPIEIQLRMIREDLQEIKNNMAKDNNQYHYDAIFGRMIGNDLAPPEFPGMVIPFKMKDEPIMKITFD